MAKNTKKMADNEQIKAIRDMFTPTTLVRAIKVAGIPEGELGRVIDVKLNGDIKVSWKCGWSTNVKYGIESISFPNDRDCLVNRNINDCSAKFGTKSCDRCGWNPNVAKKRLVQLKEDGLSEEADGTKRFIIRY